MTLSPVIYIWQIYPVNFKFHTLHFSVREFSFGFSVTEMIEHSSVPSLVFNF